MNQKILQRSIGAFVFFASFIVYFVTVQVSTSFWDCGEFIASAYYMQVPHPPGTPFFLMLGKLFSLIPFSDNIGFRVNMVSVVTSAFTVLFLYLIAIRLIQNYRGKSEENLTDSLFTYIAAAIGALSLGFGDTFWFNAVEAEVYATALFFAAFVLWLAFVWHEKADEPGNEKYLLLIAYLIGLSIGVHLFAVLTIIPITMMVMYRKNLLDDKVLIQTGKLFLIHAGILLVIAIILWSQATGTTPPSMEEWEKFDAKFMTFLALASVAFMGIFFKKIFQKGSIYYSIIIGGIIMMVVYPGVVKYVPVLVNKVGGNDLTSNLLVFVAIFAILGYIVYWSSQNEKSIINLFSKSLLFVLIGYSTLVTIVIRSNQDTPINLNSPKTASELFSYINREQYGSQPTFQRRWTREAHQMNIYSEYTSDLDFWARYQMDHMFNRFLLWNYVGRASTVQDAPVDISKFYAIPFLVGLFGLFLQWRRDWKMASVMTMLLMFLGYLMAYYSNSQEPQPRERDYFYVGAFFVFSAWIAIGARGIFDLVAELKNKKIVKPVTILSAVLLFGFIPVNMLQTNYWQNDRSRNWIPWDYAYNMLQSVEKDAIIFTNGDNDTFPLWYLQDVEGVRRDVRIANLSLINTGWYIKQLKNTSPYGSKKVKMSLTDSQLDAIEPVEWKTSMVSVRVPDEIIKKYKITDTTVVRTGAMSWLMPHTMSYGDITGIRPQDIVVRNIIESNNWERPIYFAVTCAGDGMIGLDDYLVMEGMALKLNPVKTSRGDYTINPDVMYKMLMNEPEGYSKDYAPGFKFRGLNDKTMFRDDNQERLTINYRHAFMRLAAHYLMEVKDKNTGIKILNKMEEKMPSDLIPLPDHLKFYYGVLLKEAGFNQKAQKLIDDVELEHLKRIEANPYDFTNRGNSYSYLFRLYDETGQHKKALDLAYRLQKLIPEDPSLPAMIARYKQLAGLRDSIEVKK